MSAMLAVILGVAGLLALVGWMLMRVPDPKHAMMIEMLSRMDDAPDVFVRHSHHAA